MITYARVRCGKWKLLKELFLIYLCWNNIKQRVIQLIAQCWKHYSRDAVEMTPISQTFEFYYSEELDFTVDIYSYLPCKHNCKQLTRPLRICWSCFVRDAVSIPYQASIDKKLSGLDEKHRWAQSHSIFAGGSHLFITRPDHTACVLA